MKKALLLVIFICLSFNTIVAQDRTNKLGGTTVNETYYKMFQFGTHAFKVYIYLDRIMELEQGVYILLNNYLGIFQIFSFNLLLKIRVMFLNYEHDKDI